MFHHAPVLVLALGIGIGIGQYYWVLGIGCLFWYRSNPTMIIMGIIVIHSVYGQYGAIIKNLLGSFDELHNGAGRLDLWTKPLNLSRW